MQRGRARKGEEAPLGAWLWKVAKEKGFKTRTDFIHAVGVSPPSANDWSSEAAAIPKQKTLQKIKDALKLNRDERAELDEKLKEQELFQQEMLARQADTEEPDEATATVRADVTTKQVVEYDDIYPNRAAVIPMLEANLPPEVIESLKRHKNAGGDQPEKWWIDKAFELAELNREIGARATKLLHAAERTEVFGKRPTVKKLP